VAGGNGAAAGAPREGGLAARLWAANADLAQAALRHRFVRGLAAGTLPRPAFRFFVGQDAYFLEAFARAYALALAHSPDREGVAAFAQLVAGVTEELRLHAGYAERWQIDLSGAAPGEATMAYTDFLLATAAVGGVGRTCAAMTPCMRLYVFLGQSLAAERVRLTGNRGDENPYAEWIHTYAGPGMEALAATLERLLDRYADDGREVREAYRRAMQLEVAFFEAAAARG
jgi:thiaminase/transcriptional activator TenA